MHDAAKRGNQDFLIECLTNGVSVNGLDKAGNTPLIWASHGGHVNCMTTLLEYPNVELNVQVFVHLHTLFYYLSDILFHARRTNLGTQHFMLQPGRHMERQLNCSSRMELTSTL